MPWAKIDDRFYLNPKVMRAGLEGRALYIAGLVHAAGGLTDGIIDRDVITRLAVLADVTDAPGATARLVALKLWEETAGGYVIHDYLEYNPSREHMEQVRNARSDAGRLGGRPTKHVASNDEKQNESKLLSRARVPSRPVPSPVPVPESLPETRVDPIHVGASAEAGRVAPSKPPKYSPAFEAFWRAYPHSNGRAWPKPATYAEWQRLKPDGELADTILVSITAWLQGRDWQRGYILRPDRFLKQRCWEDPPEPWSGSDEIDQRAPPAISRYSTRHIDADAVAREFDALRNGGSHAQHPSPAPGIGIIPVQLARAVPRP